MISSRLISNANEARLDSAFKQAWYYEPVVFLYTLFGLMAVTVVFTLPLVIILYASYGVENGQAMLESVDTAPVAMGVLVSGFIGIFLLVWFWLAQIEHRPFSSLGFEKSGAAKKYFLGLLLGLVAVSGISFFFWLTDYVSLENPFRGNTASVIFGLTLVLLGFAVQGAGEEVLIRGFLLPILARRYGVWVGIILSSLLFLILHMLNPGVTLIALINLFLAGVFFSLYALKEGSLWGVCGFHATWNWAMGNVFGLEVSGQNIGGADSIFADLVETGPDLITGGNFGYEGGLVVTLMLIAAIIFLYRGSWPVPDSDLSESL